MANLRKCLVGLLVVCAGTLASGNSFGWHSNSWHSTAWGAEWPDERTAGPFACHADFSLARHEPLIQELAQLRQDVCQKLSLPESDEPIHLFLFQRRNTFTDYVRHYFPNVPDRRALFIKNRGPGMVFAYYHNEFDIDVRHECTHAVLHASLAMVPLWLDEGLAEYFETRRSERLHGSPHLGTVRLYARLGQVPSMEKLEALSELSQMGNGEYRSSWAWVHFMLHGPEEAHDELVRFLLDIRNLTPPGKLSERLSRRLPNLEQQFLAHFRQTKSR